MNNVPCVSVFGSFRGNEVIAATNARCPKVSKDFVAAIRTSCHGYHAKTRFIGAGLQLCGEFVLTNSLIFDGGIRNRLRP